MLGLEMGDLTWCLLWGHAGRGHSYAYKSWESGH